MIEVLIKVSKSGIVDISIANKSSIIKKQTISTQFARS